MFHCSSPRFTSACGRIWPRSSRPIASFCHLETGRYQYSICGQLFRPLWTHQRSTEGIKPNLIAMENKINLQSQVININLWQLRLAVYWNSTTRLPAVQLSALASISVRISSYSPVQIRITYRNRMPLLRVRRLHASAQAVLPPVPTGASQGKV